MIFAADGVPIFETHQLENGQMRLEIVGPPEQDHDNQPHESISSRQPAKEQDGGA